MAWFTRVSLLTFLGMLDMLDMMENVKFRKVSDPFQTSLYKDIKRIKSSNSMYIPADKTRNPYKMDTDVHGKLLRENITKTYKSTSPSTVLSIRS